MGYIEDAKRVVVESFNNTVEKTDNVTLSDADVYVVWFVKSLGSWKALLSTTVPDGMYYEATCDLELGVVYLDAYKKWRHTEFDSPL